MPIARSGWLTMDDKVDALRIGLVRLQPKPRPKWLPRFLCRCGCARFRNMEMVGADGVKYVSHGRAQNPMCWRHG